MYHYLCDKEFEQSMRQFCGKTMQDLCRTLRKDHDIGAGFALVGSGARNLIMQNENGPVDLDYNLEIVRCKDFNDCRGIKQEVQKAFNHVLQNCGLHNCEDSTSALTTKKIQLGKGPSAGFSIDVCIVITNERGNYLRLIHDKTGLASKDRYYWNEARKSNHMKEKTDYIKSQKCWSMVRKRYADTKNRYLTQNDCNHPSFICYVEAVNNIYNYCKTH